MSEAARDIWLITLGVYALVLVVVAVLLALILSTVRRIGAGVSAIWIAGQKLANNTIHLALLGEVVQIVDRVLDAAKGIAGAVGAVRAHAESCPECPACVVTRR
ncbi:MAG TPA: hypothetical protein VNI83_05145 [Vicinamibacterales bacterium]|nr:hypothetical protein [Vicinamibacterales bacterium]